SHLPNPQKSGLRNEVSSQSRKARDRTRRELSRDNGGLRKRKRRKRSDRIRRTLPSSPTKTRRRVETRPNPFSYYPSPLSNSLSRCRERVRVRDLVWRKCPVQPHIRRAAES